MLSRIEVVETGRRRRWMSAEKLRIREESFWAATGLGDRPPVRNLTSASAELA